MICLFCIFFRGALQFNYDDQPPRPHMNRDQTLSSMHAATSREHILKHQTWHACRSMFDGLGMQV